MIIAPGQHPTNHTPAPFLQHRLDAAAAAAAEASAASPPRAATASPQQFAGDSEAEQLLQRRLAAKQREADAAGQAVAAAQQQAAQREAELAEQRARATGLADEVARWRDEFTLVGAGGGCQGATAAACRPAPNIIWHAGAE